MQYLPDFSMVLRDSGNRGILNVKMSLSLASHLRDVGFCPVSLKSNVWCLERLHYRRRYIWPTYVVVVCCLSLLEYLLKYSRVKFRTVFGRSLLPL